MKEQHPYQVTVNDQLQHVEPDVAALLDNVLLENGSYHILQNNKSYNVDIQAVDYLTKTFTFVINGTKYTAKINDKYDRLINELGLKVGLVQQSGDVKAPMPGLVLEVCVTVGQSVLKGDKMVILEAMKMENVLKAAGDGIIKTIHIEKGMAVEKGQILISCEG